MMYFMLYSDTVYGEELENLLRELQTTTIITEEIFTTR